MNGKGVVIITGSAGRMVRLSLHGLVLIVGALFVIAGFLSLSKKGFIFPFTESAWTLIKTWKWGIFK